MHSARTPRTRSWWCLAHDCPASTSSFSTVVREMPSVRLMDRSEESSTSRCRAQIMAPGVNGTKAVWVTSSLARLDDNSLLLAADSVAEASSIWNFPSRDRFWLSDRYGNREVDRWINAAKRCAN